jgi:HAE1 family hydrophobic/amphiphilic exporter-1
MTQFPISRWAIRNPIPVAVLFIALTLAGLMSYRNLAIKQWPDLTFPIVVVTVVQQGAAPEELNNQVAKIVEDAANTVAGVDAIRTTVVQGVSTTVVEFEIGEDPMEKTDDVQTAIDGIRADLPQTAEVPIVSRLNVDSQPILTYAVAAPEMSNTELSWFVENTLARRLQGLGGVAQVSRVGGVDREINVVVDPARMAALNVTAPQINNALRGFVVDTSGGRSEIGGREQTVRILGQTETVDALRNVTIPTGTGGYVRLSDVAEIGDGPAEERGFARLDGRPVVAFQVNKTQEASDVDVEDKVVAEIAKLQAERKDVSITPIVSIVEDTRANFEATTHVLIEGMILASLIVWVFLRDWRATAITVIAMPASLIPTFFALDLLGFSLNVVTLLSLTLVIGILIDDAIVEIENIQKRVERGETPYKAALEGADQIGLAVVATTAAIVVVFTPVSFMPGIPGQYFKSFGLTVAVSVLFSLLVARLLTPLMAAYFLKPSKKPAHEPDIPGYYKRTLNWSLQHRWAALGLGLLFFVGSMFIASRVPAGFIPTEDPGYYYLNVEGPPGASREDMERIAQEANAALQTRPEVEHVFVQTGSSAGGDAFSGGGGGSINTGTITVALKENCHKVLVFLPGSWFGQCPRDEHRWISTEESKEAVRPLLRAIPDARIATQGGFGAADIEVILASEDGELLERTALQLQREMRTLGELITDVRPGTPPPGPELIIRPTEEAARLGVTSETLAAVARVATSGEIDALVPKFSEGERQLPIRVRLPDTARGDLQAISNLEVPTIGGGSTPLSSVATIEFTAGAGRITRFDRERNLTVQADLRPGVVLGPANEAINQLPIMQKVRSGELGVRQASYGNSEAQAELFGGFIGAMSAGVFLILGVMVLLFRSFFKPITILLALPLAAGGAFIALLLTGLDMTMPVLIGLLMLLGLAAKNSILLVEFAIEHERTGASRREAILTACRERARPIVMTTLAMMAGMLPTALGLGEGASFRQPMAVAVIGGLISSTALSLVLIPVAYELIDRFENWLTPKLGRMTTPKASGDDGEDVRVLAPGE